MEDFRAGVGFIVCWGILKTCAKKHKIPRAVYVIPSNGSVEV